METIKAPRFKLIYAGKDITQDVTADLVTLKYKDKIEGSSDELEVTLRDGADKWKNEWYPKMGSTLEAKIGYDDALMPCGVFEIDEISIDSPPDTVTLRALAVPITGSLRTKKSKAHENTTLKQIAQKVASDNGLTLEGEIDDLQFERVTQTRETDLGFLQRTAKEFGYVFSVRAKKLIFTSVYKLEAGTAVIEIDRGQMQKFNLKDKAAKTFKKANLAYHNPSKNKVIQATASVETMTNPDGAEYTEIVAGDDLEIRAPVENDNQATAKAKAYLHGANSMQQEGTVTVTGNPLLVAGNNVELSRIGSLSGKYQIQESEHEISKSSGYTTTIEVKRVGYISITKHKKKTKPRKVQYEVEEIDGGT